MKIEEWKALGHGWLREEVGTAWLQGYLACEARHFQDFEDLEAKLEQMATDYAERVVGCSTRPAKPDPPPTPSKDENAP